MNTTPKPQNTSLFFVSHDGTDENGVRAEVFVQNNVGVIQFIKEKPEKNIAQVSFSVPPLNHPINGSIKMSEPLFEVLKTAHANKEEVRFRVETQRKKSVDRGTPIEELRKTADIALKNVSNILVGVNGVLTSEAVTNPKEDPVYSSGKYVSTDVDMSESKNVVNAPSSTVVVEPTNVDVMVNRFKKAVETVGVRTETLDSMAATLILEGVDPVTVNKIFAGENRNDNVQPEVKSLPVFEAPGWKKYNSNGSLNLGNYEVAAAVGVENMVHEQLLNLLPTHVKNVTNMGWTVQYYTNLVLGICDRIQSYTYGSGARADRFAGSHIRVRGIVYETIRNMFPMPITVKMNEDGTGSYTVSPDEHAAWVRNVGFEGIAKFGRAIVASESTNGLSTPLPEFLTGVPVEAPTASPANEPAADKVEVDNSEPASQNDTGSSPVNDVNSAPVEVETQETLTPTVVVEDEHPVEEGNVEPTPTVEETETSDVTQTETATTAELNEPDTTYPQQLLTDEQVEGEELATPETIQNFIELFNQSGYNIQDKAELIRISKLLAYTFGPNYSNVKKIPDFLVEEFIDHYTSYGTVVLDKAIRKANE